MVRPPSKVGGLNLLKAIPNAINYLSTIGLDKSMPVPVKKLIDQYGREKIKKIEVCRKPIFSSIENVLNATTLGKAKTYLQQNNYDHFYHLWLKLSLENGVSIKLEKMNE